MRDLRGSAHAMDELQTQLHDTVSSRRGGGEEKQKRRRRRRLGNKSSLPVSRSLDCSSSPKGLFSLVPPPEQDGTPSPSGDVKRSHVTATAEKRGHSFSKQFPPHHARLKSTQLDATTKPWLHDAEGAETAAAWADGKPEVWGSCGEMGGSISRDLPVASDVAARPFLRHLPSMLLV